MSVNVGPESGQKEAARPRPFVRLDDYPMRLVRPLREK
jgi:hypothetical protein